MSMGRRPRDLSGQKFGLLTAMYPTERRDHRGSVYWHCVCECGNEIDVSAGALMDGNNRSCGCLKDKNQKQIWFTSSYDGKVCGRCRNGLRRT